MSNFDKLSRTNEKKDKNVSVAIYEAPRKERRRIIEKPTVFQAILANFKGDSEIIYPAKDALLPDLKGTVAAMMAIIFISTIIISFWHMMDKVVMLPIAMLFLCSAFPCLSAVFYYEFNIKEYIPLRKLFILAIVGAFCYLLINQVTVKVFGTLMYPTMVETVVMPIVANFSMLGIIYLSAHFFKGSSIRYYFCVISFLLLGYLICRGFVVGFQNLFISNKADSTLHYNIKVIVQNEQLIDLSMQKVMKTFVYEYICIPFLFSCWGTIYSYLLYYMMHYRKKGDTIPRAFYLLIVLVFALDLMINIETANKDFNTILKVSSCLISFYVLIKLLNLSFDEAALPPLR